MSDLEEALKTKILEDHQTLEAHSDLLVSLVEAERELDRTQVHEMLSYHESLLELKKLTDFYNAHISDYKIQEIGKVVSEGIERTRELVQQALGLGILAKDALMADLDEDIERNKRIFMICPVRGITEEEKKFLQRYIARLEKQGFTVHYPPRDTDQNDPIGTYICTQNREAILNSGAIHIYWNPKSQGSTFDFGMAFMAGRRIVVVNRDGVQQTPQKSFENVLRDIDGKRRYWRNTRPD